MNIDFKMLAEQKLTLLSVIARYDAEYECEAHPGDKKAAGDLTGILHLIDALQDDAVKNGTPEGEVFLNQGQQ